MKTAFADAIAGALAVATLLLPVHVCADGQHFVLHQDARVTIASSYLHRGLVHSQSSPTWQGSLEYRFADWFGGLWASNVSFGSYDERSSEIDYYLGYGTRLSSRLAVEATAVRYTFQGDSPRNDDWTELQVSAYLGDRWTVTGGIAHNWWATDRASGFVEGTFRHPLPARLILDTTVGYQLADRAAGISYGYAEGGVSRRLDELVLRVGYAAVESTARERFFDFADDRWVASLTWQP